MTSFYITFIRRPLVKMYIVWRRSYGATADEKCLAGASISHFLKANLGCNFHMDERHSTSQA